MLESMRRFFTPPVFPDDEERTRLARLLNIILPSLAVISFLAAGFSGIAGSLAPLITTLTLILAGLYIMLWRLLYRGYTRASQILVPLQNWVIMTYGIYLVGGIHAPATASLSVVIIMAALLQGQRGS